MAVKNNSLAMKFQDLALDEKILKNLHGLGYISATEIQQQAIPELLNKRDLLGIAQTGTGKTAAFSLPIIQQLITDKKETVSRHPRVVILSPTRELASQINSSIESYAKDLLISSYAIFGGTGQVTQEKAMRSGQDIVVATPGRFLDLMNQGYIVLTKVDVFVLDEADRMLDMGFIDDIKKIIHKLPQNRQTMLFSATMPSAVEGLAQKLLKNPAKVEVTPASTAADTVSQKVIYCKKEDKFQLLKKVLSENEGATIIFTKTKNTADRVYEYLTHHHLPSVVIHGDKLQKERELALRNFKEKRVKYLIATDVAARGIDIQDISLVVNFDLPLEAESYIHRIGRTGRAGKTGEAVSFCDETEKALLEKIQRLIQSYLPHEEFKGKPEAMGSWARPVKKVRPPTPGKSQEKTAYLDHSKRQKPKVEGEPKGRAHPGFKKKKKKR